eukprot:CAMPEP_0185578922 /NCGR_PEP_ID=MMETSP0434-20130131/13231_1 /TAXON_ID=626734 ORGANISM="Favella taraikaensis, Strain Fe Narragansett Bay" /NCGR_SAMPLE_ID=MMETSP0434 /ASSEMBLY_ACC=CAM_ASM_000379 /LENGTH=220 /DNA_ID=CAMNT_0028196835 /DNA_START=280 /DNA_END=942 /DNA_ORIENTATION=+
MIVLEYLVPSTGKLYHHKMKLRNLTGESDPDEMLSYLEKRHPLYFHERKLSKPQVMNLLKKIIFKVGQMKPKKLAAPAGGPKPASPSAAAAQKKAEAASASGDIFTAEQKVALKDLESKALEKESENMKKPGLASLTGAPSFKTGSQLPTLSDDLPPLGGIEKKKPTSVKFNDQFDDDFSAGSGDDDAESPNEANNEDDEDEDDEDGDFDANALLNIGDY